MLVIAASLAITAAVLALWFAHDLSVNASRSLAPARQARLTHLADTQSSLQQANDSLNLYLITGENSYLDAYEAAVARTHAALKLLAGDAGDDLIAKEKLDAVRGLALAQLTAFAEVRFGYARDGLGGARTALARTSVAQRSQQLRDLFQQLNGGEAGSLMTGTRLPRIGLHLQASKNGIFVVVGVLLALVLLGIAYFETRRHLSASERAKQAAYDAETKFRSLFENSPTGLFQSSPDGKLLLANAAMARIFGYESTAELMAQRGDIESKGCVDPADEERFRQLLSSEDVVLNFEYAAYRKNGTQVWVSEDVRRIRDAAGVPLYCEGTILDLTERRMMQRHMQQSQKMEAIGNFAGGICHDFNNALSVISGYTELMLDRMPSNDPARKMANEVHKASRHAASLTRRLLAFSRNEAIAPTVLDLNSVWVNMENLISRVIGEDVELVAHLEPKLWPVMADHGQLEQVILNLASNARDAMPNGGRLTIETANVQLDETYSRLHEHVRPGPYALFSFTDTGIGMDEETRSHAFEPFFTTKRGGKGTGLGLASAYGIIRQSGGYIWLYSEPGRGTTLKIYLPRAEQRATETPRRPFEVSTPKGTETVLLVEDEEPLRNMMKAMLEAKGYKVNVAGNGSDAVAIAERTKEPIHLLVTDVILPGLSGKETAERLLESHAETKVLFMSGYAPENVTGHTERDSLHWLQKPFSLHTLGATIRKMLDK